MADDSNRLRWWTVGQFIENDVPAVGRGCSLWEFSCPVHGEQVSSADGTRLLSGKWQHVDQANHRRCHRILHRKCRRRSFHLQKRFLPENNFKIFLILSDSILKGLYGEMMPAECGCTIVQKTHGLFQEKNNKVTSFNGSGILILRNPYKALISYRNYLPDTSDHVSEVPESHFQGPGWPKFLIFWKSFHENDSLRLGDSRGLERPSVGGSGADLDRKHPQRRSVALRKFSGRSRERDQKTDEGAKFLFRWTTPSMRPQTRSEAFQKTIHQKFVQNI